MTFTISDTSPRSQYTAAAAQTLFTVPFEWRDDTDIAVRVDGALQALNSDYTLIGAGISGGGSCTFTSPLVGGELVTIYRDMPVARTSDQYTTGGQLPAVVIEASFDDVTMKMQQLERDLGRSMHLQAYDTGGIGDFLLPQPADRKGKYGFYFNAATGQPELFTSIGAQALSQSIIAGFLDPRTTAEIAGGVTPTDYSYHPGDARRYGCTANDGATDESTKWQNCIDGNKGGVAYIPEGLTVYAAGALLSGSTYNNTKVLVRGTFKLKASAGATNFQSAVWAGIIVHNCDNVTVEMWDADGNRSNQAANEYHHLLVIAGATKFKVPRFSCREIRGDGIYIGQATLTSNSTNSSDGFLGAIVGINSADDGRNLVSVVSCTRLHIDSIYSNAIGGLIAAVNMPGGLDIEAIPTYQSVSDVTVGVVNVTTAGTTGVAVLGTAVTNDATGDWNISRVTIGKFTVRKTGTTTTAPTFSRVFDLNVEGSVSFATTRGTGVQLDYMDRVNAKLTTKFTTVGVLVGNAGSVKDFDIHVNITDYSTFGLSTVSPQRGTFRGRVYGASSAASTFAIQTRSYTRGITQTGVIFEVDAPYDGNNVRALRNEPGDGVTYGTGTCVRNCDWSGYASFSVQCDGQIPTSNIRGRNFGNGITAAPANGAWAQFDRVEFMQTAGATSPGAICITAGAPGTWKARANVAA